MTLVTVPRTRRLIHRRRLRILAPLASLALLALGATAPAAAGSPGWPANVRAVYDVNFNGFSVGSFEFQAQAEAQSYTLSGNATLSILLGAITWTGETRSFGLIVDEAPKPAAFSFDVKAGNRATTTKMGFSDGSVTDVMHLPPVPPKVGIIPVREQHLQGVIDPLSAMMAVVTKGAASHPCDRRLPIFDGKERFDLLLSRKGEMRVTEQQPSGQPAIAQVCRVRYLPIAGHKIDSETKFMAANEDIEVVLRPIPSVGMFVPYQITIPTMVGSAVLTSKRVDISSPGKPQIALLH
jgi:hypothetical protein